MRATDLKIRKIFNGCRVLEIPFFQRSYVWEDHNWERFLEDMKNTSLNQGEYFLGSLMIKTNDEIGTSSKEHKILIDGQQRITTLLIFFKVLCLKSQNNEWRKHFEKDFLLQEDKKIALTHNRNDRNSFEHIMNMESFEKDLGNYKDGNSQVLKFYAYLSKNMDVNNYDYETIISNIRFVVINLNSNDDEQQIFDTTNSLGLTLTTAELLKNHLFSNQEIDLYKEYWEAEFEKDRDTKDFWDKEIITGRLRRKNIDLFLYSYLQIKINDERINVNLTDKSKWRRVDLLFHNYKKFREMNICTKEELVKDIKEYAQIYRENISSEVLDTPLTDQSGIQRINTIIFGLENSTLITFILFILKNTDEQEQNKVFDYLESYILRRVICKSSNKNYNNLFSDELISNELDSVDKLKAYINTKDTKLEAMPKDDEVRSGFSTSKLINNHAAIVLYLLETKIRDEKKHSSTLLARNRYSLEHLMPKKWKNNWGTLSDQEEIDNRNKVLLTLGNLTIITSSLNSSIRDSAWEIKKNGKGNKKGLKAYASGLDIMNDILDKDVWDEKAISQRASFLANKSLEAWNN